MSLTNVQIQNILNKYGFQAGTPDGVIGGNTKGAVARFQTAYNMTNLAIDAQPGPATQAALAALDASNGQLSPHFTYKELCCKHCGLCFVNRELLKRMENLRNATGPVSVLDAYRCPAHNATIGGAPNSQHVSGLAFDPIHGRYSIDQARQAGFTGIGYANSERVVDHLDARPGGVVSFQDPGTG